MRFEKYYRYKMNGRIVHRHTHRPQYATAYVQKRKQNFIHKFYRSIKHIALTILVVVVVIIIISITNEFYIVTQMNENNRNEPFNVGMIKSTNGCENM